MKKAQHKKNSDSLPNYLLTVSACHMRKKMYTISQAMSRVSMRAIVLMSLVSMCSSWWFRSEELNCPGRQCGRAVTEDGTRPDIFCCEENQYCGDDGPGGSGSYTTCLFHSCDGVDCGGGHCQNEATWYGLDGEINKCVCPYDKSGWHCEK